MRGRRTRFRDLRPTAQALRVGHGAITLGFLGAIGHVWWSALTGRRTRRAELAAAALIGEGVVVGLNHGDCPLGPLQDRVGDPVPLFELVLSPRAAKRAVPILGVVAGGGIALLLTRPRGADRSTR